MPGKRKRSKHTGSLQGDPKRQRLSGRLDVQEPPVKQTLLPQYYPEVWSLRELLLSKLPASSRIRRKKLLSVGRQVPLHESEPACGADDAVLANFLDQTIVGVLKEERVSNEDRLKQWITFSQRADVSASTLGISSSSQSEIVDFAIWLLFSKAGAFSRHKAQHLLCQGFRRDISARSVYNGRSLTSNIPGLVSTHLNANVTALKSSPWPQILTLMGREGEGAMIDLILDCGIFVVLESGHGTYHQLSGIPLGELQIMNTGCGRDISASKASSFCLRTASEPLHTPGSISFVRNRMLYARPALNAKGGVRFGLKHIHALNRFPNTDSKTENASKEARRQNEIHPDTVNMMMYLFPRQFGLHNVFTSQVDSRETVQPFKDYTLREEEIKSKYIIGYIKLPKRLRGETVKLVQKLQVLHSRCPYQRLLEHYCPIALNPESVVPQTPSQNGSDQSTLLRTQATLNSNPNLSSATCGNVTIHGRKPVMMDHATPAAKVSAFCRAVLLNLIPHGFWGDGDTLAHNERVFFHNVAQFVELRRFETLNLHKILQRMRMTTIKWLAPPNTGAKISQTDFRKRMEIFQEFIYYLFDSILIPLIRTNFHVTESNVHRYHLFYFRHDVWRSIAEPSLATLKLSMFEEVKLAKAQRILDERSLGFSQVRLLPKKTGIRPIMNLRRRMLRKGSKNMLGSSINSILSPLYNVFNLEKALNPGRLGSTMFSVGDLYHKLKAFKVALGNSAAPLYFAKVDVQSAFDTIPQKAVVTLMSTLPSKSRYRITKHVEIKPGEGLQLGLPKPMRKWVSRARAPDDNQTFNEILETDLALGKKNTVFVENIVNQFKNTDDLLKLLDDHIQRNMVKIGKKFYRQKQGIPQGSVLSSLLCNYFYADLETKHLSFLQLGDSLLLRLIDDFLLVTTSQQQARQFLQTMHNGLPDYGVRVNPNKTLTNFEVSINGQKIKRLVGDRQFPYCGNFIHTRTLDISKDRTRHPQSAIADSLTIEYSKFPGRSFTRKTLAAFKIQAHAMFLDTAHNSLSTVLANLASAFEETALKMWLYARSLPKLRAGVIVKTIEDVLSLAFLLLKSKGWNRRNVRYECRVSKRQVDRLALVAFETVLRKRQSEFVDVLSWIRERREGLDKRQRHIWKP
ncbi:hypothetical protein BP5796_09231 [Coleophoma crateriformis]|uniref:Telomerase reverse transcriptase n=1 Tax=Coleophoma crateriformis TaxID=565419 RepID=A0A3D8R433_9HELO|nr:hypothetical protein BP5796_09231 [Coleophoma crateriformis]